MASIEVSFPDRMSIFQLTCIVSIYPGKVELCGSYIQHCKTSQYDKNGKQTGKTGIINKIWKSFRKYAIVSSWSANFPFYWSKSFSAKTPNVAIIVKCLVSVLKLHRSSIKGWCNSCKIVDSQSGSSSGISSQRKASTSLFEKQKVETSRLLLMNKF